MEEGECKLCLCTSAQQQLLLALQGNFLAVIAMMIFHINSNE